MGNNLLFFGGKALLGSSYHGLAFPKTKLETNVTTRLTTVEVAATHPMTERIRR
jgi:hypothetical protein